MQKFDIASYLQTDEDMRIFLQEVADPGTASDFIHAVNIVARAKGMNEILVAEPKELAFENVFNTLKTCGLSLAIH